MNLQDIGKNPINDESPAGRDVTYDDSYEELTGEIKKLSSPTADTVINWSRVTELGAIILEKESKNLTAACYLSVALLHTGTLRQCAEGIHILRDLLETYWDILYPPKKRKKGRINALSWWNDKLRELLVSRETETWEKTDRDALLDDIRTVDSIIADKLPDGPILRSLIDNLARLVEEKSEVADDVQEDVSLEQADDNTQNVSAEQGREADRSQKNPDTAVTASTSKPSAPQVSIPDPANVQDVDINELLKNSETFFAQTATAILTKDHTSPISYQLNRINIWGQIGTTPPAVSGKTMLPGPDAQLISLLAGHFQSGNWKDLLLLAESHVREYLFWLDLSYYTATSLEQLQAKNAAAAVASQTLLYSSRFPAIQQLQFSDGTPFASTDTKEWLQGIAGSGDSKNAAASDNDDNVLTAEAEAMKYLADNNLVQAIQLLKEQRNIAADNRTRFKYEISLCQVLLKARKTELAIPYIKQFVSCINTTNLEQWEPELAAQALLVGFRCLKQSNDQNYIELLNTIQERIILTAPEKIANII